MASDTARLKFLLDLDIFDGFVNVAADRHDYAMQAADENGRDEPNAADELDGFRRLIDCAMDGGDVPANVELTGAARHERKTKP